MTSTSKALLLSLAAVPAQATPTFKPAPGVEKEDGGSSFGFDTSLGGDWGVYLEPATQFLAESYGYLGIVFVVLVLYLFVRGVRPRRGREAEEIFFDDGHDHGIRYR